MCVFFIHKSEPVSNTIEIITPIVLTLFPIAFIFFFCEFGEMLTNQFNVFDEELCQCDWYAFPVEIQRMLVIVMINTQQTTALRGYANTFCTRDFFKKVFNIQNLTYYHEIR